MVTSASECIINDFGLEKYYSVVDGKCVYQSSFFKGEAYLHESVGYVVVVGFGAVFAALTAWLIYLQQRYVGTNQSSEWFNTAGRSVKTGLIASVIVSQWTWAATLLQSSNVAYKNGVSGPFWYASGATVQVLLFGVMAIEIKRKAPNAHTMCEVVKARWGTAAHIVMLSFGFLTNIIVTAMLLLGGSAVVNALTGMNIYAASFLIPVGVLVYTLHGGLQATFLAAYLHSFILHIVLLIFIFLVYCTSKHLGSPKAVYDKLHYYVAKSHDCTYKNKDQSCGPVEGNRGGSYLTMLSTNGLVFGIINIIGNFGTVFVDNGYWMSAIAARPSATHKGYLLGGLVWFCVPFAMGTSLGLGALALDLPITLTEAGQGLVPPATAAALMGKAGAILILIMVFMAVTSAGSSELIAVSTLITYDIYRTYINPNATGKQILYISRVCVAVFGLFMGVLAIILNEAGVSLGWMYLVMGVLIGSAVVPVALLLLWEKANGIGAIAGSIIGMITGIVVWMGTTAVEYGRIDLNTTGKDAPTLAGNLASILTGGLIHIVLSLIWPQEFDWEATKSITRVEQETADFDPLEDGEEALNHARGWIIKWGIGWTVLIVFLWPVLALPAGVFSEGYFTMWAVISICWATIGSAIIIIMPLWENWETLYLVCEGLFSSDLTLQKLDDIGLKVSAILATNPDAEKVYLLEKEKLKAMREDTPAPGLELKELAA